jgi:hypothetical protein
MLLRALRNARLRTAQVRQGFYLTSSIFTVVGLAFAAALIFGSLTSLSEQNHAHDWIQVPCTVVSSSANGNRSSYLTVFAYSHGGTDYQSDRANFYATTSNTRYGKGYALTGWIDPAHPERFVQDLHYAPPWYLFLLLFVAATVPFLAVLRIIHGMATLSPSLLRYLGEKPDDNPKPA